MRANRAMWMAAALMAGAMIGRADAADTANEAIVRRLVVSIPDRNDALSLYILMAAMLVDHFT